MLNIFSEIDFISNEMPITKWKLSNWKLCLEKNKTNQIFNIASGKATKFSTIIYNLIKIIKPNQKVKVIQKGITYGDLKGSLANIKKTKKYLNFTAKTKLKNGLLKMWQNENKK